MHKKWLLFFLLFLVLIVSCFVVYSFANVEEENSESKKESNFIKWVDFNVTAEALNLTANLDIASHRSNEEIPYHWIELLSYLACKNGGDFKNFKKQDLDNLVSKLKNGETMEDLTQDLKFYDYYYESYSAILGGMLGKYSIQTSNSDSSDNGNLNPDSHSTNPISFEEKYGVKAFLPIAKNYSFSHYDDFGNSRSYGFKRTHLGNDLMGSIGTPIIAVESGVIENLGWNQYGGWRIGIRSFDSKRYYYYAHLRKNHPYSEGLQEGMSVKAGDVIGYLGMTGYSIKENVNNINIPHLHFGMQLIFDESQVDSPNEIWIDVYPIIEFLMQNRSEVYLSNPDTKDYSRKFDFMDGNLE
ncbi:MAG: M23 family metallopeptidase [Clostridia bacterium]|nr:M23 family metallopeptidase [Clostridia bacterium]